MQSDDTSRPDSEGGPETAFTIALPPPRDMKPVLRRMRRFGLRSPREHLIVEAARVILLVLPAFVLLAAGAAPATVLAFLAGYFLLRWFTAYTKPWLLLRFGPTAFRTRETGDVVLRLDDDGVEATGPLTRNFFSWKAVHVAALGAEGLVIRIAPEASILVPFDRLPDGVAPEVFRRRVLGWWRTATGPTA